MFCCVCLRNESAKEKYKYHYKKRSQYSECQTNQTRIRCISSHTVSPLMNENDRILRDSSTKVINNNSTLNNRQQLNRQALSNNKKYQFNIETKQHCPSIHNYQSSNYSNGQSNEQTSSITKNVNKISKRSVNQSKVYSELNSKDLDKEQNGVILLESLHKKPEITKCINETSIEDEIDK